LSKTDSVVGTRFFSPGISNANSIIGFNIGFNTLLTDINLTRSLVFHMG